MPRIGKKRKLEEDLENLFTWKIAESTLEIAVKGPKPETNDLVNQYLLYKAVLQSSRYASDRLPILRDTYWFENVLSALKGRRFRQQLRMNLPTFQALKEVLSGDKVFSEDQTDLDLQLAVVLYRFGRCGNGASVMDVSSRFGISEGSVHLFSRRVISALNRIKDKYVIWPNDGESKEISNRLVTKGFPNCIGMVDGTLIPFSDKPLDDHEDYYCRKSFYGMQLQLIVDDNKKILHYYTGLPASVHDSTAFRRSAVGHQIGHNQYIIGDSAYPNNDFLITPFRKKISQSQKEIVFNRQLSSVRVCVEHAIGILKNRFQSLKQLRVRVDKQAGHRKACEWISACCVLYNFVLDIDPWDEQDEPEEEDSTQTCSRSREDQGRRLELMELIWDLKQIGSI